MNTSDSYMKEFCSLNGLKNLINKPASYKNSEKPTCIDLIPINQLTLFQRSVLLETGLSHFHLLTVTKFKMIFQKCNPHIIIGTTKTMTMMSLELKSKPFVL